MSKPTSRVDALRRQGAQHRANIEDKEKTERQLMNTMLSIGNVSRMSVDPLGQEKRKREETMRQFKTDFPEFTSKSVAQGIAEGTAYVDENFSETAGDDFDQKAESHYGTISAEDAPRKPQKKPWWDIGGSPHLGGQSPVQYYEEIAAGEKPSTTYSERVLRTTFRMIDDLPRNEKGEYVINGIPYSHTELVGILQPQVMQSLHPQLLRDQEYRDDLAKSMGYNNMDALLAQLDQQLADLQKQIEADTWKQQSSVAASNPSVYTAARGMLEQTLSGEVEGLKAIRDARDQVAAMRKGDFRSGFAEGFDLRNVASFGLTGLGADVTMLGVLNKVKDGVPLTETESRMYSIYGIQQELNSIDNAIGTSLWRGIGQGVGASAELAPQFIAGMGLANRIFKGGAIGAKAGVAATRQAFNTSVWNGLKVGAMETMKVGGRAALNLGKYQVSGLIAAPLMPGTWASYAEKRQNQFKVADGQLVYTPTKAWMDLYDTLVEQSTEIASERFGGGLSDVLRSTAQQFGRALQLDRIGTAIGLGGDSKYIFGFKKSDAFRAFERNVGFSGVISEPLSEVWGDITSNVLKMAVTGNGDLSALGSLDYWKTAFAVSTIYGGALQTLTIPERVQYYKGVAELGKRKREILKKVEDKELANELEMLSIDDSLMTSAKRMADLDWSRYNIKDIAAAMDYVRTEIGLQVSMGYSEEQYNLRRFANAANYIEASAYTGIDGKNETTDIYRVVTTEGNVYTIISGDISNVEEGDDLLMAVDANGERVTLAKTKGNVLLASTVEREIQQAYTDMFSSEAVRARIVVANQLFDNIEDDLTMDQATNIASSLGIVIPHVGDTVKLVDGREVVCELLSETAPGRFSAWYVDDKGTEWTLSLDFTDILSSVDSIGVEQKLMLGENITEQAQEELMEEEIADASGVNIETENASRFTEGNVINTPEGQGKVLYVTGGKYVVDLNMSEGDVNEMALKEFTIEEIEALNANTVDEGSVASEEVAAPITPTAEEVSIDDINEALNEVSDIKVIPRAKDGSVNFDAIDDPMLFAQTFADEMGSKEAAAEAVTNMRNAEAESVKKIEKASKKATSANDIVANKKKLDATKQRITFYDDVLAELTKTKEAIPETAEVVTPPEDVQPVAEIIEPSVAEVAEQVAETPSDLNERASLREDDGVEIEQTTPTATTPQPTTKAGLVKNDLSAKLTDRLQKTLDAMAQAMGVTVTFVDKKITTASGGKANARIIGNQVEISWKYRTAAIRFLMGHEFTHRMKDLSPEAYAAFEQSVKEYLGEEKWNKRVEELRSLYERQRVPITDELAAEEVTADFVGDMAYDEQTFDKYVESNKEDTGLLASIARIFRSIADFFRNIGDKAHAKRLDNMSKKLDALIAASSEAVANGAQSEGVRYSISEGQASAIIEAMKANAEVAPQIELTPENWAAEVGSEGIVSTPIGEVKMGANQYQKMEQPDRRTKLGMVKPTLTNPDVIIEESSKPKDGRVPERNSSYVFVKAFTNVDGSRDYMFTSVSNLRDGIEIVISNQEKETPRIKRLLKEGKLAYINKATLPSEFTASAQGDQSTIPSEVSYSESKDTTSSPNIQEEGVKFSLITPEMDASYLDAVERGDMETAQTMVMEAAKLAMPNTKVVDEDGNPKVVYHGSNAQFTVFDTAKIGSTTGTADGRGFYFTTDEDYARGYVTPSGKLFGVFLNIDNHLSYDRKTITKAQLKKILKEADKVEFAQEGEHYMLSNYADYTVVGIDGAINEASNLEYGYADNDVELIGSLIGGSGSFELIMNAVQKVTGKSGMIAPKANDTTHYIVTNPSLIKSADPVTYDDAGNVIPLSERFNPKKEDIRYSLSNRPTGLINDFAEEFESLQKEYASLDPTTIHAQHPFRIRKRKVVQRYLNYVSEVLGHNVENIVYDKSNNSHVKKVYDKLKPYLKGFKEEDYSVFVESIRNRENQASYIVGSNIIIYEINNETSFMDTVNTLSAYIHENIHRIIEKLGVDEKTLEDILEEGLLLKPDITQSYIADYLNDPKHEQGEETLAYAIGNRIKFSKDREKLLNAIEGKITAKELFGNKNISVPLRDSYIETIVNELHNEYESRKEGEYSTGADSTNRGEVDKVDNQGLWRGYFGEEPERRGGGERRLLTPTRYSVRKDDMPFFYDEGGDVIIFDDLEDAPAEYISSAEGKPRITEETLSTFIKGRHSEANMRIREETDDLKKAMKARYLDEKRKRLDGIANARTNSGKVAVILGDTAVETLSLEDQALVMIAEGEVHIVWDADKNGRKGIAGELGLSNAERANYKSITKGATVTFEKFVHQWWESIGGYEKGIDTQDMRNALIEALSEAPTAKRAIEILRDKYDTVQREYDDAIYDIEASEERELANEEARYKQELEDINDPAKRRAYVRHYEQSVAFFEDMSAVQHTVRELESKISRLTRDAAIAQRRYERRVEAIKERNKTYTQERLDEQFEKNKAFLRKVLDERNEKLRKMAEGINEAKNAIKETLQGSKAIKYNSREVQSLIASIDGVRTAKGLKEVYSKAERIILNAGIRQARNDMQRLLNMRLPNGQMVESWVGTQVREGRLSAAEGRRIIADMWRGTNSRGVKVSKFVDEETAKVMKYLRDNLVLPYAKRHYQEMIDADGNTTKVLSPDLEITTDVATLKGNNDMRIAELEAKLVDGTLKADERTELDARRLYDSYLNVVDYKQQIEAQNKAIEEQRELIATQREGVESGEIDASVPKESYNILSTMYEALNDLKKSYFDKIAEFNTKVEEVLSNGRDALKAFREAQEQHRVEVIRMGLNAIGGTRVSGSPTALQKAKAVLRGSVHNSYWTFQTTLREIDRFAPNGEGEFYNYFMRMSNKATDEFIFMQHAHLATLGTYIHSLWPKTKKKTAYYAFIEIMEKANTTALPTITVYERIDKDGKGHEPVRHAMCISNAMYTIAMWNQAQYKEAMQKRGITQEVINNLEAAIAEVDDRYIEFMRLVIEEMLPDTRLEYDKVHRQLFGASMENIDNYFPAKIKREYLQEDMQVAENTLPSTITGSIISRRSNNAMPDIMQSFFAVLEGHLQNMDNWASTAPLIMDMQTLLSNAKFRDLLNSYMPGAKGGYGSLSEIFRKACAIRAGVYKSRQAVSDDILLGMTKDFATANISFRISTAIKQLSAAPLFAAYVADPRCAKIWAKYTWRGPLYKGKKMIEAAAEISPAFRERWESKTMGSEVLARKSREAQYGVDTQDIGKSKTRKVAEDSMDLLKKVATDVGMYPNVYVDAWVCATGVLTIYEYELSRMTNGKPEEATEEMKEEARYKAETFMNATQQSADSAFLSEVQMQRSVVTSGFTMYANASYGLHRLRLAGFQELGKQMFNKEYREAVRERYGEGALGDARKKAIYQIIAGVLGDVNFYLMGLLSKSVWALLSGGEDDEDDNPIWDWWEILKDLALTMGLNGYVVGGSVSSYFQGYELDVTPAFNEFFKDLEKIPIWKKDEDGEKTWDGVNMWAAASIIAKFGVGVDPDTILNIILGIEGIIKQEGWEAGMKLFNEPQSAINLVAGRRRKGETVQEYVDRRMRLEVIGSVPSYGEMFDEDGKFIGQGKLEKGFDWGFFKFPVGGAKDYKVRNLFKEFNERQANAVMRHVMTPMQRADIERTNEAYAKVCADLGWKTTTDPGDKGVDKTQKRYVYPQGLSAGRYKNLKKIAKEISDIRKELNRFAGSDEGYAEKLKEQHELKNKLIDKYDEFK